MPIRNVGSDTPMSDTASINCDNHESRRSAVDRAVEAHVMDDPGALQVAADRREAALAQVEHVGGEGHRRRLGMRQRDRQRTGVQRMAGGGERHATYLVD